MTQESVILTNSELFVFIALKRDLLFSGFSLFVIVGIYSYKVTPTKSHGWIIPLILWRN
jgi:hypothetical protein